MSVFISGNSHAQTKTDKPRVFVLTDIETHLYHYVNIENKRKSEFGTVLTQQQAEKMTSDWLELNKTLNAIFPNRQSKGCLSLN